MYQLQRIATEHSSTCHCIRFYTNLLYVLVQIANKMGLQIKSRSYRPNEAMWTEMTK
jgi:hypothetical protein